MRFPVLLVILSLTLSGCFGLFENAPVGRALTPEEIAAQQREAEAANALGMAMQMFYGGEYLDNQAAREYLDRAIELDPTLTAAWYQRATLNERMNRREEALADVRQVIRLDPHHAKGQNLYGFLLFQRAQYQEAIKALTRSLAGDDSQADAYSLRGAAHSKLGDTGAAIRDFSEAIARNPAYREAYYNRGLMYALQRENQAALHDLTQALSLDASRAETYLARAAVYTDLKQFDRAIADYTQAIVLDPDDSRIVGLLAETYAADGKYREAESAAHRAMLVARRAGDLVSSRKHADRADAFARMSASEPAP